MLTERWTQLRYHPVQSQLWYDPFRFKIAHAGRRSGKTELAKRNLVKKAIEFYLPGGRFVFAAPTHRQAVEIYWDDAKALVPEWAMVGHSRARAISESYKQIRLANGTKIEVDGMDKPERIEGSPLDGIVADEFGNMKQNTFKEHIRPALSTVDRPGWAWFIGAPEGRNHYWELVDRVTRDNLPNWKVYCWKTSEINAADAEKARGDMDEKTYLQEYEGLFVSFKGLAYYSFDKQLNVGPLQYDPTKPLIICHDFNRVPGNALILQEQDPPGWLKLRNGGKETGPVTCVIDEVFLEQDSTTTKVGSIVADRWKHHTGKVMLYGDAAGGAKTSQGVEGSDWDLLEAVYNKTWKTVVPCYPRKNPPVRVRLNCVNSRIRSVEGTLHTAIDPRCKMFQRDLEGVTCNDAGEIEKTNDMLTHISDGFGYYVAEEHSLGYAMMSKDM